MTQTRYFDADPLIDYSTAMFESVGMPKDDAATVARDLVKANLRGVDSHGVSRMPMYLTRLRAGLVNPKPDVKATRVAGAVAHVDGDNGMGFIASHRATDLACDLAESNGIGLVGVHRSTHFGMGASYALQAIERGYITLIFTNSSPAIPMWGGRSTFLGASPIAAGIPGGKHAPYVMDMAMTVIARGKIRLAAMKGDPIPEGLALDVDGHPTTDAAKAFEGVCLPFGGVKGSVLATLMDLMAGALTGANFAGDVKSLYFDHSEPQNVGHLFFAMKPDLFMSLTDFETRMDTFYERIKELPRAAGVDEIMMPGEPEQRREHHRMLAGIPITDNVIEELTTEGRKVGVEFPEGLSQPRSEAA
ncbi:Malate/lactate/ureidoglycolate dehydrogenase, LDH2 family [Aureimonas altamirensis DSM 21988]|uniref:Malate/L-sulfolactate dehydrogenase n=2 Tax=Aureimonas altamirensis TaxID=370622 RepID=A0A0P0YVH5_9HYPH|nr:Ldh family oxidoreductase [Aureimonas altamirensis]BAT25466.1 malate/L-sulfolactate dehydrogenase [Aureimonas altamirensis]SHK01775.1 Malate/lactate/ureidoglycolate dehydrogenase, LDH2 family [Aureimonas altamirensis DSM 21988]